MVKSFFKMSDKNCLSENKNIYEKIHSFLENGDEVDNTEIESSFNKIFNLEDQSEGKTKMKEILCTMSKITNNHQRHQNFYDRVEQIFFIMKDYIKEQFNDFEIFHIFRNNKRMLLFLFDQQMIEIDKINKINKENIKKILKQKKMFQSKSMIKLAKLRRK